jgi:hypothetical protein
MKMCCLLCEQNSRVPESRYSKQQLSLRLVLIPGQEENVACLLLVNPEDVLFLPIHIKLGLMKNFA